jgi:N-acetylglutamate synthase-like GNAT family acetyltransferase
MGLSLRAARAGEAGELTELVMRSKAHWGYDAEFMQRVRPALTIEESQLPATVVAEIDGRSAGVATLDGQPPEGELDLLFVEPWAIGRGVGAALYLDAIEQARKLGFARLLIESDPCAEAFYLRMGAVRIGERVSSATGRSLPLLVQDI